MKKVFIILGIIILSMFSVLACVDSDGVNYSNFGQVTWTDENNLEKTINDGCVESTFNLESIPYSSLLSEMTCKDGTFFRDFYECENGCENGA